ncbi:MAG: hypothetical protein IT338_17580 [Thermomicrobiales bacterium]|nr:hypothetical protein [Thermomicrobiales bacterium]
MADDLGQARRESTLTPEQLLAQALKDKAFPTHRFRLESPKAGASRLLTQKAAARAQARYGGDVVELVTMKDWLTATAQSLPTCERASCQAPAGLPCRDVHGIRKPHPNRLGKRESTRIALEEYLRCETCGAWPGKSCVTESGMVRRAHKDRPMLAPPAPVAEPAP